MKKLLVVLVATVFVACNEAPNKKATVAITTMGGAKDTVTIEYYQDLHVNSSYELSDENNDANGSNVKAKGVMNFSIIGSVQDVKH